MKSLQSQIVWRTIIYTSIVLIISTFIIPYIIEKKAELDIPNTLNYLRDSKFKSLNKDNLTTAYDFSGLNYISYIIDKDGKFLITANYKVDKEILDLCEKTRDQDNAKFSSNGITKYVSIKKNGQMCLVYEGNTNNTIMLGQFISTVLYWFVFAFVIILFFFLRRSFGKVFWPLKTITENSENALVAKWENIKAPETNILELKNLDKYSGYLIEILHQKTSGQSSSKALEIKQYQSNFLNKKLENEANKFKLAVDSAIDVVVIVDKFGYITYTNNALAKLTDLHLEDAENKKITDLWHRGDDANLWKQNYDKVATSKQAVQFTSWGIKKDSLKFESLVQISPIKNFDDSVDSFLIVERDVTEEKQKERVKSEFISVVSHELRTPMTVIRGYSTLLSEGKLGELNQKQKEYVDKINSETGQLLELANDMLDIQKFESGKIELKFQKTSIPSFIENIVTGFTGQFNKKNLTLNFENNLKQEFANIDLKYFARVVTNLLTNAYKYTEKGEVKVFLVNPDDHHIVIAVKDSGIGIKEEALNHLFERFYQAEGVMDRKQEGSGLGLNIVKTVTEAHSGMVWVESKIGVGSTFYVAIPIV